MPLVLFQRRIEWATVAIAVSLLQMVILVSLEAVLFTQIYEFFVLGYKYQSRAGSLPIILVYFGLFMGAQLTQAVLSWDAARMKNTMQVLANAVFNFAILIYTIVQVIQVDKLERSLRLCLGLVQPENIEERKYIDYCAQAEPTWQDALDIIPATLPIRLTIIGFMFLFSVLGYFIAWKVYQDYGWIIIRSHGADVKKKKILERYHLFILLLKLNIFFFFGCAIQFLTGNVYEQRMKDIKNRKFGEDDDLTSVTIPYTILLAVVFVFYYLFGFLGIKKTSKPLMISFLVITLVNIGLAAAILNLIFGDAERYAFARISFGLFSIGNVILNVATFYVAVMCIRDFKYDGRDGLFNNNNAGTELSNVQPLSPRTEAILD